MGVMWSYNRQPVISLAAELSTDWSFLRTQLEVPKKTVAIINSRND